MRILHLTWEYPPLVYGGIGRHVPGLAEAQAAAGHEVVVLTQHAEDAPGEEVVDGVRVVRADGDPPYVQQADLLTWVMALEHALTRAGIALVAGWEPAIVHAHDWVVAHPAVALAQASGAALVTTIHATEAGRHQGWLPTDLSRSIHSVEGWLTSLSRRVLTCSEHMRWEVSRLFGPPDGTVEVIANGIDLRRWRPRPAEVARMRSRFAAEGPLLVVAGRLEHEKGVHTMLAAMPRLRRRFPGIRLVVVGKGTYEDQLHALARRLRLGRAVVFSGWLTGTDVAAVCAAADVAVIPSSYEPSGLVALEAAAVGTPMVVARTGGLAELVEHGRTGLVVPAADQVGLAESVTCLLADPALAGRLARAARERIATEHAWPALAARTVAAYRRAACDPAPQRPGPPPATAGNLLR